MIYKILIDGIDLFKKSMNIFKEEKGFIYVDGVFFVNSSKSKVELSDMLDKLKIKGELFFVQEVEKEKTYLFSDSVKSWIDYQFKLEEREQATLNNLEIYNDFLTFLEKEINKGNFIKNKDVERSEDG